MDATLPVIVNVAAGKGCTTEDLDAIRDAFRSAGREADILPARNGAEIESLARRAVGQEHPLIVAAGVGNNDYMMDGFSVGTHGDAPRPPDPARRPEGDRAPARGEEELVRVIAHLSDLHFGRVENALLEPMRRCVQALEPHLVVVSGDLTQRARPRQFGEARRYLDSLPQPQIVVPGNHDVPLYNVFQRFATPLDKYRRFISENLEPDYFDDEIAVVGINTVRSFSWKEGRINARQVERARSKLCGRPGHVAKIIVTHHPFDVPGDRDENQIVRRAAMAMKVFARCGADILLSGHLHTTCTTHSAERYRIPGHSALIVQAGSATSTRLRGESNSFNALHVTPDEIRVDRYTWVPQKSEFLLAGSERFCRAPDGWHRR